MTALGQALVSCGWRRASKASSSFDLGAHRIEASGYDARGMGLHVTCLPSEARAVARWLTCRATGDPSAQPPSAKFGGTLDPSGRYITCAAEIALRGRL